MFFQSLAIVTLLTVASFAQTKVDLSRQSKEINFSGADSTRPFRSGVALPSTCASGEVFYVTGATPGTNLYSCTSTNTWTQLSGSSLLTPIGEAGNALISDGSNAAWASLGGDVSGAATALTVQALRGISVSATAPSQGQALVYNSTENRWEPGALVSPPVAWPITRVSDTVLEIGTGPGLRIGGTYCQIPASAAQLTIASGTGSLFVFIRPNCELVVAHNIAVTSCTSCTAAVGTGFEPNSFPLGQWAVENDILAASGVSALTQFAIQPILAGQNVQITDVSGQLQINTFSNGVELADRALSQEWNNSATNPTLRFHLASWVSESGVAYLEGTALASANPIAGIVIAGEGSSGKARIAIAGIAACEFENAVAALDWVVPGTDSAGKCRSAGATKPTSGAIVGRVLETGAVGTYFVQLSVQQ